MLCSLSSYNFDFKYSNKDEFVRGITECTVHFNTAIPPQYRAIVIVSVASLNEVTSPSYDLGATEDELVSKWKKYYQ